MSKTLKKVLIILVCIFAVLGICGFFLYQGIMKGRGPFKGIAEKLSEGHIAGHAGNQEPYDMDHVEILESSPLQGKNICFLGSSVAYGKGAQGISFVEIMAKRNGFTYVKETVSATTMVDSDKTSYIQRMINNIDPNAEFDLFVCQLSTNDASNGLPLGTVGDGTSLNDFDTSTIAGAIEYIICYAKETWDCPVIFFTGTKYDDDQYGEMVKTLMTIQEKWDIGVINMWDDSSLNAITDEQRALYMIDAKHPSMAGYMEWWTPYMETCLYNYLDSID